MVFKGIARGSEFSLDGRKVITSDSDLKRDIEIAMSMNAFGRAPGKNFLENSVGKGIVAQFGGTIIHESDAPVDNSPQPQMIY